MGHQAVLEKKVKKAGNDKNVLGLLLVGSVASGTHTEESDIDLKMIYRNHKRASGIKNQWVEGIKVQTIFFTFDTLIKSQETVPYLLHILCDAKVLIDFANQQVRRSRACPYEPAHRGDKRVGTPARRAGRRTDPEPAHIR